ncbi:hypothetical protein [Massilia sp. 9096]|uniref:hypothetical protein n=1 Tax=Massilia sp. 9096 TaxID=1500894 RepID=UPI0027D79C53|nr:hypothetical protein [Massilia sp. 9096]
MKSRDFLSLTTVGADETLNRFHQTPGARELAGKVRGVLIFPSVIAAGLGVGGEYGQGVLRVGGSPVTTTRSARCPSACRSARSRRA